MGCPLAEAELARHVAETGLHARIEEVVEVE